MKYNKYQQDKLCIRNSDKKIFIPSYPEYWNDGDSVNACISGNVKWYFKEVIETSWWIFRYWGETGEIWEPKEANEFNVINYKQHHKEYHAKS